MKKLKIKKESFPSKRKIVKSPYLNYYIVNYINTNKNVYSDLMIKKGCTIVIVQNHNLTSLGEFTRQTERYRNIRDLFKHIMSLMERKFTKDPD